MRTNQKKTCFLIFFKNNLPSKIYGGAESSPSLSLKRHNTNAFSNIDGLVTHLMRNNPGWTKLDVYMGIALSGFGMRNWICAENRHFYL